ncbi:MAG: hypothetical protein JWM16_3334 [Verrucomicrobiales bacterium]|nr:hypothetical protein [Verrucomicrobiales bacterium]
MAFAFILFFAFVCYGWGRLAGHIFYRGLRLPYAFHLALGLAVLNLIGGLLNSTQTAIPAALQFLLMAGACLATFFLAKAFRSSGGTHSFRGFCENGAWLAWLPDLVALVLAAFFATTLLPAGAFNIHDDFHTYLVRPTRMLATGTLGGNPFDTLGVDSLGTHSFYQAFFLLWRPILEINAFDAVFCFGTGALLISALARKLKLHPVLGLLAVLTFASINPQYVNISPIYAGSLLMVALFFASFIGGEALLTSGEKSNLRLWVPVGFITAALAGLKLTLALFAAAYFLVFAVLLCMAKRRGIRACQALLITTVSALAAIVPWLLVSTPALLKTHAIGSAHPASAVLESKYPSLSAHDTAQLFSSNNLFYGGNQLHYTLLGVALLCIGTVAFYRWCRSRSEESEIFPALVASAALSCAGIYALNADLFAINTAVRYSCPVLIGVLPTAALLSCRMFRVDESARLQAGAPPILARVPSIVITVIQVSVVLTFLPTSLVRLNRALQTGSLLSFPINRSFIEFNHATLNSEQAARLIQFQKNVAPGQIVFAWTALPFHFDFTRNPILTASEPGFINPWLHFPADLSAEELAEYLRSWGVRYVILEADGYSIKTIADLEPMLNVRYPVYRKLADYAIHTRRALLEMTRKQKIVARLDQLVMLDLGAPAIALESPHGQQANTLQPNP